MKKWYRALAVCTAVVGLTACSDLLQVDNTNDADQGRALSRPSDVEALISGSYNTVHRQLIGNGNMQPQTLVLGTESYSALGNFNNSVRATIPRPPIVNERGSPLVADLYAPYLGLHRAARAAALGLSRVNAAGFTFFPPSAPQVERARAFAHFVIGVALGNVALTYDSGSTISDLDDLTQIAPLPLAYYTVLSQYALDRLDSAIAHAGGMTGQTIPAAWMGTGGVLSPTQFIALARGWKARIRAATARDEAERAAVAWPQVIGDAGAFTAAYPADWVQALVPANGWDNSWLGSMYNNNSTNWHQMWGYMIHMAAEQSQYDSWLSLPPAQRAQFTMITADLRFPQGADRTAQRADASPQRYIENRANDWLGVDPSSNSDYRHKRFLALFNASRVGNFPSMGTAEMNLLAAEGHFRAGAFATAAGLIDLTRAAAGRGGLPGLVAGGVTNATTPVPGGANCVPRVPVGPSFTSSACGTLFEALKWEFRIETQFTQPNSWWIHGRGWGDLPASTPVHYPVPLAELDTRSQPSYNMAGPSASPGRYGF